MRKLCVVTGSRAEYGLLYWLLKEIDVDADLTLQLIATGMHLSPEFGLTYREIEQDGFSIDAKIEMQLASDTAVGTTKAMGLGLIGFADALERLRPDIVVVLGDRYEILAAAQAAMVAGIPIAHIHGGETTAGAIDEGIRHGITKFAHLHFVAAEAYRRRVLQLGENPEHVWNVGAPGIDGIEKIAMLERSDLEGRLNFTWRATNFLVTYHPATAEKGSAEAAVTALLSALDAFPEAGIIFTKPNSDTDNRIIAKKIDAFVAERRGRAIAVANLGQQRYVSAMKYVDVVIGNSSSGLIEAPYLGKATVNVGERQSGRLKATSVIDAPDDSQMIIAAIQQALSNEFQRQALATVPPYGRGGASSKIKEILKTVQLEGILKKRFWDV